MNPLYNIGIRLYRAGAGVKARSSDKVRRMVEGQARSVADIARRLGPDSRCVWIHAASLGEFEQARPLIERLRRERPDEKILLTFFSPSGYEVRKDYPLADCVAYLPFDTPSAVAEFLDTAAPRMAVFVKYEFWGNYLEQLAERSIPTYIISAIFRPGQVFFRHYGGMFRKMLRHFTRLYVQDERSRSLLEGIGVENVTVAGDTRFDRVTDVMASACAVEGAGDIRAFAVFGSSWPADEERYLPWLAANPGARYVIAPHEFDEARIAALLEAAPGRTVTLSEWERAYAEGRGAEMADVRGIIVDCFGRLSSLYRCGSMAYVGGGFGVGIHNINEAAVYGIPVAFGPEHRKFKEAADLIAEGGAASVADADALAQRLTLWYTDEAARRKAGEAAGAYIRRNIGATDIIFNDLFPA